MASNQNPQRPVPSKSEILSSAKVLAEAARGPKDKVDKGKVAGAAADLLGAASHYGKLEEKGMGKYVGKAEDYLRHYSPAQPPAGAGAGAGAGSGAPSDPPPKQDGKYGDYLKMAEGLLKKKPEGGKPSSAPHSDAGGSGYGDYFKMAEGLLKKR